MTDRRQHDSRPDSERRIVPQNVKFGILALLICIAHILLAPSLARAADWEYSVRPGDTLTLRSTVLELIPSRSKPDRGLVRMQCELRNQDGEVVMSIKPLNFVGRRPAS